MALTSDAEEEMPLDPALERVRRKMMRLMFVSIGIMMVGLMAVLAAIVYKAGKSLPATVSASSSAGVPVEPGFEGRIALPQGAEIVSTALDGDHVLLQLQLAQGTKQILVYSLSGNRIIARLAVD